MKYSDTNNDPARCLSCGDPIGYGRRDRKFCNDSCRMRYHNQKTHRVRASHGRILTALNRNYEILDAMLRKGTDHIDLGELLLCGFNENCFTGMRPGKYYREYDCFEITYRIHGRKLSGLRRLLVPQILQER